MNLPASFIESTRNLLGSEAYEELSAALSLEPAVSIRLNRRKMDRPLSDHAVPWCPDGFYLNERPTFTFDPLFHAGCYYVQEASSMFVEQALKQYVGEEPLVALDLCAAPGGKSTLLRSLLSEDSLLVANEVIRSRSQILAENLTKWGHPGVVVTNNDPSDFASLNDFFDVILTDVPCSGEGMFRKDPGAVEEWSPENVEICWQRQRRILTDIWPSLKPGGLLIYSTCTYNTHEDEENVRWIRDELGASVLPVDVSEDWHITGNLLANADFPVYRFLPHKTKGEGFFLAVLRKSGEEDWEALPENTNQKRKKLSAMRNKKSSAQPISKEHLSLAASWLSSSARCELVNSETRIFAFPTVNLCKWTLLQESLRIVQVGLPLAEVKGRDLIPEHALAMSSVLRPDAFVHEELDYHKAIAYLRKEAISLSESTSRGYVLVTYKNVPLGFVKNVGNRANNLYPQEWRIRSNYLPEEIKTV